MAEQNLTVATAERMIARHQELSETIDRLSSRESHYMTPADWQELDAAQNERADLHFALKRAGCLHLIDSAR
ncbi:hypothetical protein [Streptomyces sp. NPDC015131]|uniref:hypothetical protein n=1 Tax=Streptomyces sp. NPDC015131 TaxID=3364941 RepID=UPI0036F51D39